MKKDFSEKLARVVVLELDFLWDFLFSFRLRPLITPTDDAVLSAYL
jgi:hypothetical protein